MCKNTWKPPDERPSAEVQRVRGHVGSHSALSWWHRGSRQDTQGEPVACYVHSSSKKAPYFHNAEHFNHMRKVLFWSLFSLTISLLKSHLCIKVSLEGFACEVFPL